MSKGKGWGYLIFAVVFALLWLIGLITLGVF